jgi:pSer/pThr/pTyr-binding forkhead associated (FHA) protein
MVAGRHSSADLRLPLPDVSRRHCRFAFSNGSWQVFDLSSLNGLFVNNERVEQAMLHHLDLIRIGSYTFQVVLEGVSANSAFPALGVNTQENIVGPLPEPKGFSQRKAS